MTLQEYIALLDRSAEAARRRGDVRAERVYREEAERLRELLSGSLAA